MNKSVKIRIKLTVFYIKKTLLFLHTSLSIIFIDSIISVRQNNNYSYHI